MIPPIPSSAPEQQYTERSPDVGSQRAGGPVEPEMSEQQIWARELERRRAFEQRRLDGDS
jgi:hypothetical protein